jgi:AcrR family transcriptional regulator
MTARSEDERAAIVAAARAVLRRSGFEGFKVQLVLRETGLSARSFYRHFPEKDSLVVALIRDEYAATARRLSRATAAAGPDPEAQVAAWIRELLLGSGDPALEPRTRLFSSYYLALSATPDGASEANRLLTRPLVEAISRGQAQGLFCGPDPEDEARHTAQLAGGALNGLLAQQSGPSRLEPVVDATTDFALRALRTASTFPRDPC